MDRGTIATLHNERIGLAYQRAVDEGIADPVVFIGDAADSTAHDIVRRFFDPEQRAVEAKRDSKFNSAPVFGAEQVEVSQHVSSYFPVAGASLKDPPSPGFFWLMVVAGGGYTLAQAETP